MRIITVALLLVHGLFHLLGFVAAWRPGALPQLSGRTIVPLPHGGLRAVGLAWLLACGAFCAAAILRAKGLESWWRVAVVAIVLSQALIVLQWRDAWAGTLVNALLALVVAVSAGTQRFYADNRAAARALLARAPSSEPAVLDRREIAHLPTPVQRWLETSGAVGRPRARTVRLRQRGALRTGPGQPYVPAAADQYFTVDPPGFVWTVDVTMFRVVPIVGRDSFVDGRGRMLIRAAGLVTVADGTGPTFDQGTALRFLGEIIWFPSAALAPYITWRSVDERHADATIAFRGVTASATFEFDERGRFAGLKAQRYYDGASLESWVIPIAEWRTIRGIEMPVRGGAVWKLADGDFDYYQWEILDVEPNQPALWSAD